MARELLVKWRAVLLGNSLKACGKVQSVKSKTQGMRHPMIKIQERL